MSTYMKFFYFWRCLRKENVHFATLTFSKILHHRCNQQKVGFVYAQRLHLVISDCLTKVGCTLLTLCHWSCACFRIFDIFEKSMMLLKKDLTHRTYDSFVFDYSIWQQRPGQAKRRQALRSPQLLSKPSNGFGSDVSCRNVGFFSRPRAQHRGEGRRQLSWKELKASRTFALSCFCRSCHQSF